MTNKEILEKVGLEVGMTIVSQTDYRTYEVTIEKLNKHGIKTTGAFLYYKNIDDLSIFHFGCDEKIIEITNSKGEVVYPFKEEEKDLQYFVDFTINKFNMQVCFKIGTKFKDLPYFIQFAVLKEVEKYVNPENEYNDCFGISQKFKNADTDTIYFNFASQEQIYKFKSIVGEDNLKDFQNKINNI